MAKPRLVPRDMSTTDASLDPYRQCEAGCSHDLSRGVLVGDLLSDDGPYPVRWVHAKSGAWLVLVTSNQQDHERLAA